MEKYKKVTSILFIPLVLLIVIIFLWCNDRSSSYFNQNRQETTIVNIIANKNHIKNKKDIAKIKIEGIKYFDSKIALCYSYEGQKEYDAGLFEETLLPPYVKMIYLAYGYSDNALIVIT